MLRVRTRKYRTFRALKKQNKIISRATLISEKMCGCHIKILSNESFQSVRALEASLFTGARTGFKTICEVVYHDVSRLFRIPVMEGIFTFGE